MPLSTRLWTSPILATLSEDTRQELAEFWFDCAKRIHGRRRRPAGCFTPLLPGVGNPVGTLWLVGGNEVAKITEVESRHQRLSQSLRRPSRFAELLNDYLTFVSEFLPAGARFPDAFRAGAKLAQVFRTGNAESFRIRGPHAQVLGATEHFIDLVPTTRSRQVWGADMDGWLRQRLDVLEAYAEVARPDAVIVHAEDPALEACVGGLRERLSKLRIFHARLPYPLGHRHWSNDALRLAVLTLREYHQTWEALQRRL